MTAACRWVECLAAVAGIKSRELMVCSYFFMPYEMRPDFDLDSS